MDSSEDKRTPVHPDHMDRWSRNQRLYETLKGMGLFATPIPEPDDPTKIREIIVSADLPPDVSAPVQRPEVGNVIGAPCSDGDNVINFPPKV